MSYTPQYSVIANDAGSHLFRNYVWTRGLYRQHMRYDTPRIPLGMVSHQDNIVYYGDMCIWEQAHHVLRSHVEENPAYLQELIDDGIRRGEEMNTWTTVHIQDADLSLVNTAQLWELLDVAGQHQSDMYATGTLLVFIDFQSHSYIDDSLKAMLERIVPAKERLSYYQACTAPVRNTFGARSDEALLMWLASIEDDDEACTAIRHTTNVMDLPDALANAVRSHTEQYCWIYYAYGGPAYTADQFLAFASEMLERDILPSVQLQIIEDRKKEYAYRRKILKDNIGLSDIERVIIDIASEFIWAKPVRKEYQSKSYYHIEKLQREIGKRLHMTLQQVRSCPLPILRDALCHGKAIDIDYINRLYDYHVTVPDGNAEDCVRVLTGDHAQAFDGAIARPPEPDVQELKELRGDMACSGRAKGTVRIVNEKEDISKMQEGDVLVSFATTPTIVAAMKKAAAIVTDEGGLTCHAAIVSRELNIPCVVGTKIATKVFKDGDMVEVDADKEIITIIT